MMLMGALLLIVSAALFVLALSQGDNAELFKRVGQIGGGMVVVGVLLLVGGFVVKARNQA